MKDTIAWSIPSILRHTALLAVPALPLHYTWENVQCRLFFVRRADPDTTCTQVQPRADVKIAVNTTIDIYNAGCPLCEDTIALVNRVAHASVQSSIHDELIRSALTTIPENAALCAGRAL